MDVSSCLGGQLTAEKQAQARHEVALDLALDGCDFIRRHSSAAIAPDDDSALADRARERDVARVVVDDEVGVDEAQILDRILDLGVPPFPAKNFAEVFFERVVAENRSGPFLGRMGEKDQDVSACAKPLEEAQDPRAQRLCEIVRDCVVEIERDSHRYACAARRSMKSGALTPQTVSTLARTERVASESAKRAALVWGSLRSTMVQDV